MDPIDSKIKLYDRNAPGHCREELAANFNPGAPHFHVRWDFRPTVTRVAFHQIKAVPGITPQVDVALHDAGIHSIEDLDAAGLAKVSKLPGVKAADAKALLAWAAKQLPLKPGDPEPEEEELDPYAGMDPALRALIDHQEHEKRQAGIVEENEEDAGEPAETPATGTSGNTAPNSPAQPGDSAPTGTPAPATTGPEAAGSGPTT